MTRPAFVYALADPTGIRYVGQSLNPYLRLGAHTVGWNRDTWASVLDFDSVRFLILEATDAENADEREAFWIAALCWDHPLLNVHSNPSIVRRRNGGKYGPVVFLKRDREGRIDHSVPARFALRRGGRELAMSG